MYVKSTRPSAKRDDRIATIESRALGALKLASEAGDENVPAKRADFFTTILAVVPNYLSQCTALEQKIYEYNIESYNGDVNKIILKN